MRFPSYTNFIFGTVSYGSSSSCCSLAAAGPCCSPWLLLLPWPLLLFAVALFLLFLFPRRLSISSVLIPCYPSSCYIMKKQFHVRYAVFLQVTLVFVPRVLIQRCVILKLYFSKMNLSFINIFLRNF